MLQMLTESLFLAIVAGIVALLTVVGMKSSLLQLAPANIPRLSEVNVGAGVLLFAFFLSIATGILFGLAPALQASSVSQVSSLREGSRGSGSSRSHTRISRILVISEIALSLILLVGAGLLLRSFWRVLQVQPGFNPHGVLTAQIWMPVPNDPSTDPIVRRKNAPHSFAKSSGASTPSPESKTCHRWREQSAARRRPQ